MTSKKSRASKSNETSSASKTSKSSTSAPRPGERPRTAARARQRELRNATEKLGRLAAELPGAKPETALTVTSATVVETKARAHRCVFCDGELELREHLAVTRGQEILREVVLACRLCHTPRRLFFRVLPPLPA